MLACGKSFGKDTFIIPSQLVRLQKKQVRNGYHGIVTNYHASASLFFDYGTAIEFKFNFFLNFFQVKNCSVVEEQ